MHSDDRTIQDSGLDDLEDALSEMTESWHMKGIDHSRIHVDGGGTIIPEDWDENAGDTLIDNVPALGFDLQESQDKLVMGNVIGEGGAGVVRIANQPALARDVAVKILLEAKDEAKARARLLREARVTGALEHPNIVPIHDIGHDGRGVPMIVMKRIEGRAWADLLDEDRDRLGEGDPSMPWDDFLERHVQILIQVARAIHFAHARHVIHRDLKPENVMIGPFGEVYVVDWGISVGLGECNIPGLPRAADTDDVFGTPAYMAPEMVGVHAELLTPRTDVYLLGATLYEILVGRPPHRADTLMATLARAYRGAPPRLPREVPSTLARICHRAMQKRLDKRFGDAAAFADALAAFLKHRHSLKLSEEGARDLERLYAALDGERDARADAASSPRELYRECRVVLEQALRIWDGNDDARAAMQLAAERMIEHELSRGEPEAARALLVDLQEPRAELTGRIDDAARARQARAAHLSRLERDQDVTVSDAERARGAVLLSVGSVAVNLVAAVLDKRGFASIGHLEYAGLYAANLVWGLSIVLAMRGSLLVNTANRRVTVSSVFTIACYIVVMGLAWAVKIPFAAALVLIPLLRFVIWSLGTLSFDRRLWPLPVMALIEMPLVALWPRWGFEIIAASIGSTLVSQAIIWWRSARASKADGRRARVGGARRE